MMKAPPFLEKTRPARMPITKGEPQ